MKSRCAVNKREKNVFVERDGRLVVFNIIYKRFIKFGSSINIQICEERIPQTFGFFNFFITNNIKIHKQYFYFRLKKIHYEHSVTQRLFSLFKIPCNDNKTELILSVIFLSSC